MSNNGWLYSGADAVKVAEREIQLSEQKSKQRGMNRFWLKKGSEAEIIMLDSNSNTFCCYEHSIPGPGNNWKDMINIISPKSCGQEDPLETHPVVDGKPSTPDWVQFYSILDLTPYETKDGRTIPYTRKLLRVKKSQIQEFHRLAESAMDEFKTLRGLHLRLVRDDSASTNIGRPMPLKMSYAHLSEKELIERYGHPAIKNKDGKVIVEANGYLQPFVYMDVFELPDVAKIRKQFGIDAPMGSAQEANDVWGQSTESVQENKESESKENTVDDPAEQAVDFS